MKAQWEPTHWTHNTHNVNALREKLCLGKMWSFTELESCLLLSDRRACKDVHLFLMSGCPWKSCQTRTCRSSAMSNILQISLQSAQKWIHNTATTYLLPSMTSPGVFMSLWFEHLWLSFAYLGSTRSLKLIPWAVGGKEVGRLCWN